MISSQLKDGVAVADADAADAGGGGGAAASESFLARAIFGNQDACSEV